MADKPVTREEMYLAYLTGDYTGELPKPITRKEKYLYELCLKGMGGEVSPEEIKNAVNEYLEKNPVKPGATTEQAQQIEKNKKDVASLKEDISTKITKFYASNQGETHLADSDNGKIADMILYGKSEQKQYSGRNLFNKESKHSNIDIGNYFDKFNRSIVGQNVLNWLDEEGTDVRRFYVYPIKANSKYTLFFHGNITNNIYIGLANASGIGTKDIKVFEDVLNINIGITTSENETYLVLNTDGTADVMLELGSEATSFEPYTGSQPSPSPDYPQEIKSVVNPVVKVCGKNLLDAVFDNSDSSNEKNFTKRIDFTFCAGKTYTISTVGKYAKGNTSFFSNGVNIPMLQMGWGVTKNVVTPDSNIIANSVLFDAEPNSIGKIQIEEGSTPTAYEPYHEQTVTLPYTLNAIPVSSGGNVTIDGQQYIADYADAEKKKRAGYILSRQISPDEIKDQILGKGSCYIVDNRIVKPSNDAEIGHIICSHLTQGSWNNVVNKDIQGISLHSKSNYIGINITGCKTVAEYKDFFKNNNVTIMYQINPTYSDLQEEISELSTYYPATNVSVTSEQLDGYTVFNYPISMANGWNYVKQQLNDNRDYIYDMDLQSAEAYVNSEYAVALTELEV